MTLVCILATRHAICSRPFSLPSSNRLWLQTP